MRLLRIAILAATVTGCGAPSTHEAAPTTATVAPGFRIPVGAAEWRIDSSRSELRLLVYRAGAMAHLGHNHVIVNRSLHGMVGVMQPLTATAFSVDVPLAAFAVDDTAARAAEGTDFAGEISDEAKAGTRHNMLGSALLDAEQHPVMRLRSIAIDALAAGYTATLYVEIAGRITTLTVPFQLVRNAEQLTATANFPLRQSALGLAPFSVMLGALQVQDEFIVKLTLVAVASG